MRLSRQEYWSSLPCPPPGDLPNPGMEPVSPVAPALQVDGFFIAEPLGKPMYLKGERKPKQPFAMATGD